MIFLTGATGFLGRHILHQLLAEGQQVRALVRNPEKANLPASPLLELCEGDVRDVLSLEKAMDGAEYAIHSAALVSFWKRRREEMTSINVDGTANVVNCALDAKVKKLVHISSVAALGRTKSTAV